MDKEIANHVIPWAAMIALILSAGCAQDGEDNIAGPGNVEEEIVDTLPPITGRLAGINDWCYQLDAIDIARIGASKFDLVVMDYSADGSEEQAFSNAQIQALKESPGGPKLVVAYMSIGEAEDYRFYWKDAWESHPPDWLGETNPEWPGNFKVRYWDPEWQRIVFGIAEGERKSYLDRIVGAGFDGAYLDIIDAYEYWSYEKGVRSPKEAAEDMIALIIALSEYARNTREEPDFLIFPQNGSGIITEVGDEKVQAYFEAINGIGAEDTFYGDRDENNPLNRQQEVIANLDRFRLAGKVVLAIDYLLAPEKIADFYTRARARGYIPYSSVRDLNRLIVPTGHEPD